MGQPVTDEIYVFDTYFQNGNSDARYFYKIQTGKCKVVKKIPHRFHALSRAEFFILLQNLTFRKGWKLCKAKRSGWYEGHFSKVFIIEKSNCGWSIHRVGHLYILE